MKIAYFVHGRGRGHAIRSRAVLSKLRQHHEVRAFCGGEAWTLLRDLQEAEPVVATVPGTGMVPTFLRRLRKDRLELKRWSPNLVVSDGDGPSVNAAWSLGIPITAVGHGLSLFHSDLGLSLPWRQFLREKLNVMSSSWPAERRVAVHFAPARPNTAGTIVARPDLPRRLRQSQSRENFLLAYFRDDNGAPVLEKLLDRGHRIVCFGNAAALPAEIELHPLDVDSFADALLRCEAVVASAGNQLPAECAMLGIAMLALYENADVEQKVNAQLVEAAGIGVGGAIHEVTPELLHRFEMEIDKPRAELAARTLEMLPVSTAVATVVAEFESRLNAAS